VICNVLNVFENLARPERLELPTTWFEVFHLGSRIFLLRRKRPGNSTFTGRAAAAMIEPSRWYLEAEHGGAEQRAGFLASPR